MDKHEILKQIQDVKSNLGLQDDMLLDLERIQKEASMHLENDEVARLLDAKDLNEELKKMKLTLEDLMR